ncbi:MAG: hypothetical protein QOK48_2115, partial [Blastocatellia bacterium]|nr:hypothetical protein [Blastocatellia bacterium]
GGLGNDLMFGNAGDDCMDGSAGNDFMFGNQGKDRMFGGPGIDIMFGNDGNDCMDGGDDRDFMSGNLGDDTMLGGNGNDIMLGNQGDDLMDGGAGNDVMFGNQGNDNMFGGPQLDFIWGGLGSNTTNQNGSSGVTCAPCIPPKCDLKIEKKVQPTLVKGQQATATITVTNVGGALCSGPTTVTEAVPAGLTLVSASGPGWVCSGAVCTYANSIPVNGSVSVTYTFNVTAQPGTAIQNCATVSNQNDNNPANNQSCVTTPVVVTGCDREITKTVTPNPVQSGQQVTTTLTVTNVGTAPCPVVGGINLADSQPSGWTFQLPVSANKPGWSCGFTGPGVSAYCTSTSPLLPGAANAVSITFTGKITAPAGSTIQNCAGVTNVGDVNQANNNSCVNVTVKP